MDNWELTQEELELEPYGEGEEGGEDNGDEIYRESFLVMSQYAQVHTDSLDSYHKKMSAEVYNMATKLNYNLICFVFRLIPT